MDASPKSRNTRPAPIMKERQEQRGKHSIMLRTYQDQNVDIPECIRTPIITPRAGMLAALIPRTRLPNWKHPVCNCIYMREFHINLWLYTQKQTTTKLLYCRIVCPSLIRPVIRQQRDDPLGSYVAAVVVVDLGVWCIIISDITIAPVGRLAALLYTRKQHTVVAACNT